MNFRDFLKSFKACAAGADAFAVDAVGFGAGIVHVQFGRTAIWTKPFHAIIRDIATFEFALGLKF